MGVPVIKQAAVVVVLLGLCACSGGTSDPAATGAGGTTAATTSASSVTGAPSTDPGSPAAAPATSDGKTSTKPARDGSSAVSIPDQLCVFLDQEQLKVQDISSNFAAKARLGADFKTWTAKDKDRKVKTTEVDAISSSQCPKVRARILDAVRAKNLTAALG